MQATKLPEPVEGPPGNPKQTPMITQTPPEKMTLEKAVEIVGSLFSDCRVMPRDEEAIDLVLSHLEGAQADKGWQPIETAPQTSKSIIVWCPERKNTYTVSWRAGVWNHFGGSGQLWEDPTHWRPLPDPPAPSPSEQTEVKQP